MIEFVATSYNEPVPTAMGKDHEQTETIVVNIRSLNLNQKQFKNKLHLIEDKEGETVDRKDGR